MRNPAFRRLWLSRSVSHIGDGVALIALVLYVKGIERSGLAVGTLLLAQSLPHLLGPFTGALVDRLNLKPVMLICELSQAVIFSAIAWWQPGFIALLPLVVAASLLDTTFNPASNSTVPGLVEPSDRMQANAWIGTSLNLQVAIGPFLGGFLVTALGVRWALAANALSFLLSASFLAGLPSRTRRTGRIVAGVLAGGMEGLKFAWRDPAVRALVVGIFFVVAFAAVDNVALVFLARDTLGTTAFGFGAIAAAFGVGMLGSSVALSWLQSAWRSTGLVSIGWLLTGIGTLVTGVAPTAPVAALAQTIGGVGNGTENVAAATLIQERVSPEMLGRVFGIFGTAAFAGTSVAYVLAGILLDATSPRMTFIVGGIGGLVVLMLAGPALWRGDRRRVQGVPS